MSLHIFKVSCAGINTCKTNLKTAVSIDLTTQATRCVLSEDKNYTFLIAQCNFELFEDDVW